MCGGSGERREYNYNLDPEWTTLSCLEYTGHGWIREERGDGR
jgi:hypothetical protein